jgi:hypothetical protein
MLSCPAGEVRSSPTVPPIPLPPSPAGRFQPPPHQEPNNQGDIYYRRYIIREIEKSCSVPVVDSATTDYKTTMAPYKFYKKWSKGGVVTYINYKTL